MVLIHLLGNAGDVGCLPRKHIDIHPQEGDERAFLFAVEGGAYGESPSRAILPDRHLLGLRWLSSGFLALAGRALWHVLDVAQHSEEVRLPEWVREVLPGFFFPPGTSAAGASALAAAAATASR